jgi:cell division topological specificity factor
MTGLLERLTGHKPASSAQAAKERLKLVLIHDRSDISPGMLDSLKDKIILVTSRHVAVDAASVTVNLAQEGRTQRLVADIPLGPASRCRRLD